VLAGGVGVLGDAIDAAAVGEVEGLVAVEIGVAAILAGDVGAQPLVEAVADADAAEGGGVKTLVLRPEIGGAGVEGVFDLVDPLVGKADVAAQIPAAVIGRLHRRRRLDHRNVGGIGAGSGQEQDARQSAGLQMGHHRVLPFKEPLDSTARNPGADYGGQVLKTL